MADQRGVASLGPYLLRTQAGKLFLPNELAHEIKNMYPMDEGTLRSIWGPAAYVPIKDTLVFEQDFKYGTPGERPLSSVGSTGNPRALRTVYPEYPVYGQHQHGIFHTKLYGRERSVLLLHTGYELWEFRGWHRNWRQLLSSPASSHGVEDVLRDDNAIRFPTQFEATGTGIVIVPQDGRAYFYDGEIIAPLGFSDVPETPSARGPEDSNMGVTQTDTIIGSNDTGYAHSGLGYMLRTAGVSGMTYGFGHCRLGTVSDFTDSAVTATGWLNPGEWRCKVQFIDRWGNLSALSNASEPVQFTRQGAKLKVNNAFPGSVGMGAAAIGVSVDALRMQIAWAGVPTGPEHCVGRIIHRTKDLKNSGDVKFYELALNSASVANAFATLPDNVTTIYPDNIPDSFLTREALDIVAVPKFKLCKVAFGRLWIGNIEGQESAIMPSMPGQWGTFKAREKIYPDATGGEITGLWRCPKGLLVFTRRSSFLVQVSDDGARFRPEPLSSEIGCHAPSSLQTTTLDNVIWLGSDGFYSYDGESITPISGALDKYFKRATKSRFPQACSAYDPETNEYRCWVSTNGNVENDTCFIYDGNGWRIRTDFQPRSVCVTQDHRSYMLAAGSVTGDEGHSGVYLLDHVGNRSDESLTALIDSREALIETVWLDGQASLSKKTVPKLYLWFRETEKADITVEVMRDWRDTVVETVTTTRYSTMDVPPFWGEEALDSGGKYKERRPFWTRAQIYLPSAETFKFRIRGTGAWEFVGLSFDESPRYFGGAQTPG